MPQVICSCGAVVLATRTQQGLDFKLGSSITRNCEELRKALQQKATAENFVCQRLSRLAAERMRPRRPCGSLGRCAADLPMSSSPATVR